MELIVEVIFGISVNNAENEVTISPNLCEELRKCKISISDVMVFKNTFLDVCIHNGEITYKISDKTINVKA